MARSYIGVTTDVSVQSAPTSASVPSGRLQLVGITARGPRNYVGLIKSITEYTRYFGARTPYETLYDTARTYFQEGGGELVVTRVVGDAATNGSVTLQNDATTPVDVLTVEVQDPGEHSADYRAVVSHNTDLTFNLQVLDNVTGRVIAYFQRAESPSDLASLAIGNEDVKITALSNASRPAQGPFAFSAGSDDRASVGVADYGKALDEHKGVRAGVAVAAPGQHPTAIAPVLGAHCAATRKIGLLEIPVGLSEAEALSIGAPLLGSPHGEFLSMPFYPSIRVPDGTDRHRTISPVGYVAAARSVVHRTRSFAAAVAGPDISSKWSFSPSARLDNEAVNELNQNGVNAIQSTPGKAPYLNNWSSLSNETGLYDLNVTDALNNLSVLLEDKLSVLQWRPNEGRQMLRADAQAIVDSIMQPLVERGYLFPTLADDTGPQDSGYRVQVEDIRTSGQASPYDQITVVVSVKLSPTLRHIHVPIYKVDLRQAL